jgi:hypothetical protein
MGSINTSEGLVTIVNNRAAISASRKREKIKEKIEPRETGDFSFDLSSIQENVMPISIEKPNLAQVETIHPQLVFSARRGSPFHRFITVSRANSSWHC